MDCQTTGNPGCTRSSMAGSFRWSTITSLYIARLSLTGNTLLHMGAQLWIHYIDCIFLIWQGSDTDLVEFVHDLNQNAKNIKLSLNYNHDSVEFLDTLIFQDQHGYLQSNMDRKSTSVNSLLHTSSSHPSSTKKGIVTGQFLQARWICSLDHLFLKQAQDLIHTRI